MAREELTNRDRHRRRGINGLVASPQATWRGAAREDTSSSRSARNTPGGAATHRKRPWAGRAAVSSVTRLSYVIVAAPADIILNYLKLEKPRPALKVSRWAPIPGSFRKAGSSPLYEEEVASALRRDPRSGPKKKRTRTPTRSGRHGLGGWQTCSARSC